MRLAAQAKMGYYPTPDELLPLLCSCLKRGGPGKLRILDPCAGYGAALKIIGGHLDAVTYGIELDRERGLAAQQEFYHCLLGDCLKAQVSRNLASLLFLNPPYDWASGDGELEKAERYERTFLRQSLKWLRPCGVLVYLIPIKRLDKAVARMLAGNFESLRVFRFPEPLYEQFRQAVILGIKKAKAVQDQKRLDYLLAVGRGKAIAPFFPQKPDFSYEVPPSMKIRPLIFRASEIDQKDLAKEIKTQGLYPKLHYLAIASEHNLKLKALMPLRLGHLAQLVACGLAGGVVRDQDGRNPLLVKGVTKKVIDRRVEHEKGREKHIETERFVITVNAYDRQGRLITIS